MKQSQDPFEAAFVEQESPPESPAAVNDTETQIDAAATVNDADQPEDEVGLELVAHPNVASTSAAPLASGVTQPNNKNKDEDDDEEEDNMDVELGKLSSSGDPDKMAKMQTILSRFTEEQMSRYESFRRSGFQRSNMKRLLVSITGSQKISVHMSIVASGIAKMFVGELVETAKIVMSERKDSGPIRPCHIRESYRRLKMEGKVPKRSVPRLFR
ncbi:transcription initiation factor TFIID subunit 11-like [Chenopodium quinoa]|nr:transcription initiation factor TFIID subunit 11-like [Chenopodium quinoa]XP_021721853.1 transcription initiation factor TFIID subunit 11-like [Chenopodium quinoa]XP_021721854.1 transcription initiation factor TFIID subunit 11-like [Chenopodium quinoa]